MRWQGGRLRNRLFLHLSLVLGIFKLYNLPHKISKLFLTLNPRDPPSALAIHFLLSKAINTGQQHRFSRIFPHLLQSNK